MLPYRTLIRLLVCGALTLPTVLAAQPSHADELLYVYGPDCGACMKFMKEVGSIYPRTAEAEHLPLVIVTLDDWRAGKHPLAECAIKAVFGTPTFIHVHECAEIDRITGYSNDELFWLALGRLVNTAKANATP